MQALTSPLGQAVVEIERHVSESGWDQPAQLFALVRTTELLGAEPRLADELGADAVRQELTPVAQDGLPPGADSDGLAGALARIEWPDAVSGCAIAVERVVLPSEAEPEMMRTRSRPPPGTRDGTRYGWWPAYCATATGSVRSGSGRTTRMTRCSPGPTWSRPCARYWRSTFAPVASAGTGDDEENQR